MAEYRKVQTDLLSNEPEDRRFVWIPSTMTDEQFSGIGRVAVRAGADPYLVWALAGVLMQEPEVSGS